MGGWPVLLICDGPVPGGRKIGIEWQFTILSGGAACLFLFAGEVEDV